MSSPSYSAIAQYREEREELAKFATKLTESNLRPLFLDLLNHHAYARGEKLRVVDEEKLKHSQKRPDGALRNILGLDVGYWESKGPKADLDQEINKKINAGYPTYNILFENSQEAILYQDSEEKQRVPFDDEAALDECLRDFVTYRPKEIRHFEKAIERFKSDLPKLLEALRQKIDSARNSDFIEKRNQLLDHCKFYINPVIEQADIREMLIQHILTADIFERVFTDAYFHREHHLASEMNLLQKALLGGQPRKAYLTEINYYYEALGAAAGYVGESEKQNFLKHLYQEFYKAYNPKAADRLGIVYTPTEIVKFIVRNADDLLKKHFGRGISDKSVDILDPATGTGTFICELIKQMDKDSLSHKYKHELHANEISLLAYYVANLNIEYAYKQKMGTYAPFEGLCFVDTIDLDVSYKGKQGELLAGISDENIRRVEAQQEKSIHLIIGNPPYNANQQNENENNKNREYPAIDKHIKSTFVKLGTAQLQAQLYDMYVRFYRWAMDRLKDEGMVAFITNRSFIDARTFDGFRKVVQRGFDHAYVVDLGGDVRAKGTGAGGNVFGIMTGVAIMFLIKKKEKNGCRIHYFAYPSTDDRATKLRKLSEDELSELELKDIQPDKDANWINQSTSNFDKLPVPLANKETKLAKYSAESALFKLYSNGVKTNRDSWVCDRSKSRLKQKMQHSIKEIKKFLANQDDSYPTTIKWSDALKKHFARNLSPTDFDKSFIVKSAYRPFTTLYYYADKYWNDRLTSNHTEAFGENLNKKNSCICFLISKRAPFCVIATKAIANLAMFVEPVQCLPLYRYDADGRRVDNITNWGLEQFQAHYEDSNISREQIFAYTYAVLHAPAYREKYAIDLERHFPRLPFYEDFEALSSLGQQLLDLHLNYEQAAPYPLQRVDRELSLPRFRLRKSRNEPNCIEIDEATQLLGVPDKAWAYVLGNRSALEWVLSQYKEKKDDLPPIEGLRPYCFSDYKEEAIELLQKVCTVSVETTKLVAEIDQLTCSELKE